MAETASSGTAPLSTKQVLGVSAETITSLMVIAGAALCCFAVVVDYYGYDISRSMGRTQSTLLGVGGVTLLAGVIAQVRLGVRSLAETLRVWAIAAQLGLIALALRLYQIESRIFYDVVSLVFIAGFISNHYAPAKLRPLVFFAVGIVTVLAVLAVARPLEAAILIGLGLLTFWIANLPIRLVWRVGLIVVLFGVLAAIHAGFIAASWSTIVIPLFASMFMFRLAVYLYDVHNGRGPKDLWSRLGYFFLPPNPIFPFFPVVDFATYGRSYYNKDAHVIYQRGVELIVRGMVHLLLYRVVYLHFTLAPEDVASPLQFFQFIAANFALYLRISGSFHVISGVLVLFGFNLPETHSRFYFSTSFIEFWRRTNIYWKDFMQKMFFNPAFTRLKNIGAKHMAAVLGAIAVTFVATWTLHAYQWFWLRGHVPFSWPDLLFWTMLGLFLMVQTYLEDRSQRRGAAGRRALMGPKTYLVLRTSCTMLVICLMWSFWTSPTVSSWWNIVLSSGLTPALGPNGRADAGAWVTTTLTFGAAAFALLMAIGAASGLAAPAPAATRRKQKPYRWGMEAAATAAVVLALVGVQGVKPWIGVEAQLLVEDISQARLNRRDQAELSRGYYEELTSTSRFNSPLWEALMFRPHNFQHVEDQAGVQQLDTYLAYEYIPGAVFDANGATLTINRWGMRDDDYELAKPANTTRIVLIEASRALGTGVEQGHNFEAVLEQRLNQEFASSGRRFEILNFSVDGYLPAQRLLTLEEKALPFQPDITLYGAGLRDTVMDHFAQMYHEGRASPFPLVDDVVRRAGVDRSMPVERIAARLRPYRFELLAEMYRRFVADSRAAGATPVWFYLTQLGGLSHEDRTEVAAITRLARQAGFVILEMTDVYDGYSSDRLQIGPWDANHPNADGHRIVANTMFDRLLRLDSRGAIDLGFRRTAPPVAEADRAIPAAPARER